MSDLIVVKATIKDVVGKVNVAGDFAEALDKKARELLKDAVARSKDNKRSTVMPKDLPYYYCCGNAKDMLAVRSKIKEVCKDCNVAGDLAEGMNNVLNHFVRQAVARAQENKRNTVMAKDL
ncbi:MAG: hypothetical protein Q7R76_03930 [Candidatus Woesearchaeota archaeon]|nr:hypothetical protein [Candidatus Woesearchaeota archaeon]